MVNEAAKDALDDVSASSPLEDLLVLHRKEKKDLQAKITSLKHSVAKGDKKRKKDLIGEIAQMENDLKLKQEAELNALQKETHSADSDIPSKASDSVDTAEEPTQPQRVSKAQKRREKKDMQAKEHNQAIIEDAINAKFAPRNIELAAFARQLAERDLQIHDIPADGDCLYNAVAHQLSQLGIPSIGDEMRKKAADYIRCSKDDFLPFLTDEKGDVLPEEQFDVYCDTVQGVNKGENGGAWGGEAEIRALSMSLKRPIEVLQTNAPKIVVGAEFDAPPILITYHRHAYRLGEHYNSTEPLEKSADDDDIDT